MKKTLYNILGFISTGLGLLGIVLPLLPTTPFLILGAFCFAKSSDRFYSWIMTGRTGKIIKDFKEGSYSTKKKVKVLILITLVFGTSIYFVPYVHVKYLLLIILMFKYYYIFFRLNNKKEKVSASGIKMEWTFFEIQKETVQAINDNGICVWFF